jgi:hypothetical protein
MQDAVQDGARWRKKLALTTLRYSDAFSTAESGLTSALGET